MNKKESDLRSKRAGLVCLRNELQHENILGPFDVSEDLEKVENQISDIDKILEKRA